MNLRFATVAAFLALLAQLRAEIDFNQDVRPILSDKCFRCHGPDAKNQKSDFRLDSFEAATADLGGYAGVVPGKTDQSELHARIHTDDPDEVMPPPKTKLPLTSKEREILDRWIAEGAKYEAHWAFQPLPGSIPVPAAGADWARNSIDRFIAEKLAKTALKPSAEAGREKWLRRVTFDLTGLPPTLTEIDAFLADSSPNAHEAAVDRLLDTDAYAERMTSEWLDVARYSDTYGYQVDRNRNVWPWRDWVIRAFRQNLPYDRFITWQIAGDLLPNATRDQILATCFNRLHPQKVEGGSTPEEFRIEYVSDRVHTFGTAFLGLTLECSRCHDHKYDPVTMGDYYSLSAFFNNIDEAGLYSYFTPSVPTPTLNLPTEAQEKALAEAQAALTSHQPSPSIQPVASIVHLPFEEAAGGKLKNLADPDKPASTSANNKIVPGKIGNAIRLTGDDAVNLPKGVGDFTRDQPFSYALWLNPQVSHQRAVVVRRSKAWTDAASRGYELLIENGRLSAALIHFWPGNAIRVRAKTALPLKTWTHVAVSYDGSSTAAGLSIFVNGAKADVDVVRDNLTREITGGGDPFVGLGQRMRDKGFKNGLVDEFRVFAGQLTETDARQLADPGAEGQNDAGRDFLAKTRVDPEIRKLREKRSQIAKSIPEIMVMREMPGKRPTFILERGLYTNRADEVSAATPEFLPALGEFPPNRLGLAKWLTAPNHPLTARVTVNRYWQLMFGRGLVSTSEDFGSQGKPPTHPALLDWLARDFIENGWDLRHLLKQIALSATYRQKSQVSPQMRQIDPENLLLARYPAARLTAEMIRDNALAVSGLLAPKIGGPSVKPYDLAVSFKPIKPDTGENLYRRSLYTFWKRTAPAPVMMTLDASKRDVCRVKRERTASPLQSLVLLNGPQFVEAARVTAERLLDQHGSDDAAIIAQAFRQFTSRAPQPREREILAAVLTEQQTAFAADPKKTAEFLKTGAKAPSGKHAPERLAAVATLVSTLMNFDESYTKR